MPPEADKNRESGSVGHGEGNWKTKRARRIKRSRSVREKVTVPFAVSFPWAAMQADGRYFLFLSFLFPFLFSTAL